MSFNECHLAQAVPWRLLFDTLTHKWIGGQLSDVLVVQKDVESAKLINQFIDALVNAIKQRSAEEQAKLASGHLNGTIDSKMYSDADCSGDLRPGPLQYLDAWKGSSVPRTPEFLDQMTQALNIFFERHMLHSLLCIAKGAGITSYKDIFNHNWANADLCPPGDALYWYIYANFALATGRGWAEKQPGNLKYAGNESAAAKHINRATQKFLKQYYGDFSNSAAVKAHAEELFRILWEFDLFMVEVGSPFNWKQKLYHVFGYLFDFNNEVKTKDGKIIEHKMYVPLKR